MDDLKTAARGQESSTEIYFEALAPTEIDQIVGGCRRGSGLQYWNSKGAPCIKQWCGGNYSESPGCKIR